MATPNGELINPFEEHQGDQSSVSEDGSCSSAKSSDDGGEEQEFGLSRKGTNFVCFDSERLDKSLSGSADMSGKIDERRVKLRQIIKQHVEARGRRTSRRPRSGT